MACKSVYMAGCISTRYTANKIKVGKFCQKNESCWCCESKRNRGGLFVRKFIWKSPTLYPNTCVCHGKCEAKQLRWILLVSDYSPHNTANTKEYFSYRVGISWCLPLVVHSFKMSDKKWCCRFSLGIKSFSTVSLHVSFPYYNIFVIQSRRHN
jgi:hypothetical protein